MKFPLVFLSIFTAAVASGCNRDAPPPRTDAKPDNVKPAPVRPGDPASPTVPGPNPQMGTDQKK